LQQPLIVRQLHFVFRHLRYVPRTARLRETRVGTGKRNGCCGKRAIEFIRIYLLEFPPPNRQLSLEKFSDGHLHKPPKLHANNLTLRLNFFACKKFSLRRRIFCFLINPHP
jgi:hypothetical protein